MEKNLIPKNQLSLKKLDNINLALVYYLYSIQFLNKNLYIFIYNYGNIIFAKYNNNHHI